MMKKTVKKNNTLITGAFIGLIYAYFAYYYYHNPSAGHMNEIVAFVVRALVAFLISTGLIIVLSKAQQREDLFFLYDNGKRITTTKTILIYMALFSLMWLPLLIIKYPGALCWDTWDMIHMYRTNAITAHHSVFYTVAIGTVVNHYEHIGFANIGLFLFIAMHFVLYIFSFSYALYVIESMGAKKWIIVVVICLWLTNPYITGYIGVAMKDSIYATSMLLITALLIEMSNDIQCFTNNIHKCTLLFAIILIACLVRKNGVYLAMFMTISALIKTREDKRYRKIAAIIALSAIAMYGCNYALDIKYEAQPSSVAEALSVPFQQTARYVKYHRTEITPSEMRAIDDVLDYERLPDLYNPQKSDYVKGTYKGNNKKLKPYFKVWQKQFLRHPGCYLAAFANQNLYVFVPQANKQNIVLYQDDKIGYEAGKLVDVEESSNLYEPIFSNPKTLKKPKKIAVEFFKAIYERTPIGILCNIAICTYLFLIILFKQISNKKNVIMEFSVGIVALIFALLGPAVYGHPRYLFPIVYTIPMLVVYYLRDTSNING